MLATIWEFISSIASYIASAVSNFSKIFTLFNTFYDAIYLYMPLPLQILILFGGALIVLTLVLKIISVIT